MLLSDHVIRKNLKKWQKHDNFGLQNKQLSLQTTGVVKHAETNNYAKKAQNRQMASSILLRVMSTMGPKK